VAEHPLQEGGGGGGDGDSSEPDEATRASEASSATSLSLCKTRPASGRPLKHRKRKVEKSLQKAREKIEAAGGTWIPAVPYEEFKKNRTAAVTGHREKHKERIIKDLPQAVKDALPRPSLLVRATVTAEEMNTVNARIVINGQCQLCGKGATDTHMFSAAHISKVQEEALAERLAGISLSGRRFRSDGKGYQGPLHRKGLAEFWGNGLETMPATCLAQLRRKNGVTIYGPGSPYKVTMDKIRDVTLAFVSYSAWVGKAAYKSNTHEEARARYIDWIDLADSEETTALDTAPERGEAQGWWPVCVINVDGEVTKWYKELVGEQQNIKIIQCFYQLLGEDENRAWLLEVFDPRPAVSPPPPPLPIEPGWQFVGPAPVDGVWEEPPPEPAPRVPPLRGRPAIPDHQSGPAAAEMEEMD
jgi:hypothetical protein